MGPFALLSAIVMISGINANDIICQISVSPIPEGGSTSIICVFPFDLVKNNASFLIRHDDLKTGDHHTVVECSWDSVGQNHSCEYIYEKLKYTIVWINHEVKLIIPRASRLQAGNYSCALINYEPATYTSSPCTLNVTETRFVTNCTTSSVMQGLPAAVTCHFNKNLNDVQADFLVLRQPLSARGNNEESLVLYCTWRDNIPDCWNETGYNFNASISSTHTLEIPAASPENQGRYTCRVQSSLEAHEEPCVFKILDETTTSYTNTTLTTQPPVPSNGADTGQIWTTYFGVIIGLLVVIVVLIVLVVGFIVVYKRLPRCLPQAQPRNQEDVPLRPVTATQEE